MWRNSKNAQGLDSKNRHIEKPCGLALLDQKRRQREGLLAVAERLFNIMPNRSVAELNEVNYSDRAVTTQQSRKVAVVL